VCQTFETSAAVCTPTDPGNPGDPTDPSGPGAPMPSRPAPGAPGTGWWAPAGVRAGNPADPFGSVAGIAGQLPRTGADVAPLAQAGGAFLAAGVVLRLAAGMRRRRVHHPAHLARPGSAP
jgi:hypothetical protein